MDMKITNHFGVYGICYENQKLLCIKKNAGPYQNRLDLPGGSQEFDEGLTETLVREVSEETGFTVSSYDNPRIYDAIVREDGVNFAVHHIMAFYDFKIDNTVNKKALPEIVADGRNDSDSIIWVELSDIAIQNASPVVLKAKEELKGNLILDKMVYNNWQVK